MKFLPLLSITALTSSILIAFPQGKALPPLPPEVFLDLSSFTAGETGVGTIGNTTKHVQICLTFKKNQIKA